VVVVQRAYALQDKTESFKAELLEYPGIMDASVSLAMPGQETGYFPVRVDTTGSQDLLYLVPVFADRDFLQTMQLYLVEGRNFRDDTSCLNSIIINEAAVKRLGLTDPLGRKVRGTGMYGEEKNYTIVGVVRDYHFESLHRQIEPLAMALLEKSAHVQYLAVRMDGSDRNGATGHIEKTWKKFVKDEPFDYYFLDEDLNMQYKEEETTANIFSIFSFLAIFIAALGLFGLASHTAEQRTREIGIRKAMGASINRITLMLAVQFTRWVLWASLIAIPVAWIGMRLWLSRFAYHITIDGWLLLLAAVLAFIIAILTVSYQAIRSAKENPVHALQYE
jgi:putative ABC transport system permease protein